MGQTWCRCNRCFEGVERRGAIVVPVCVDVVVPCLVRLVSGAAMVAK
jgi:hypothetical protein